MQGSLYVFSPATQVKVVPSHHPCLSLSGLICGEVCYDMFNNAAGNWEPWLIYHVSSWVMLLIQDSNFFDECEMKNTTLAKVSFAFVLSFVLSA